jgi:hypothetical protein
LVVVVVAEAFFFGEVGPGLDMARVVLGVVVQVAELGEGWGAVGWLSGEGGLVFNWGWGLLREVVGAELFALGYVVLFEVIDAKLLGDGLLVAFGFGAAMSAAENS